MAIFNRVSKEEKEINDLINKKRMLSEAIKKEINGIQFEMNKEYQKIGSAVYAEYSQANSSEIDISKFSKILLKIDDFKNSIKEKQSRIHQICDRYDEEILILRNTLGTSSIMTCPNCNEPYTSEEKFCTTCGKKLNQ